MVRNMYYTRYHRTTAQAQDARWITQDTRYVKDFYQVIIRSEIQDLRSKIPKQYSSALPHIPPITVSYGGITFFTSWPIKYFEVSYIKRHTTATGDELRTLTIWQENIYDAVDD